MVSAAKLVPNVSEDGLPMPRRAVAIAALCAGTVVLVSDGSVANVALPTIARYFGVPGESAVSIITVYQLVVAMTTMAFAALGDRIGQKNLYRGGLLGFALVGCLSLIATSLPTLLVIRATQAIFASAAMSVSFGLVRATYPHRHIGKGLGLNTLAGATGSSIAPVAGGLILAIASWRWVFFLSVPIALISTLLGRMLPDPPTHKDKFDSGGAALCAAAFGLLIVGLETLIHGGHGWIAALLILASLTVGALFVRHEMGETQPVLPVDLLSTPAFALSVVAGLAGVLASSTLLLSMSFRLQHGFGFSPAMTGAMIAPYAIGTLITAPTFGMLSDHFSPKILCTIGSAIAATFLVVLAYLPPHPSHFDIVWRILLCSFGFGMFTSPNARVILGSAPKHRAAAGGGLVATTRMLGLTFAATIVAALLALDLGNGPWPCLIGAGLAAFACFCSIVRPAPPKLATIEAVEEVAPVTGTA